LYLREEGEERRCKLERRPHLICAAYATVRWRCARRANQQRYAYRRLGSHSDAEDLAAQTFQRALEAIGRYEERGLPFGAWLFRIAHNLIVDRRRVQRGDLPLDGMLHDPIDRDPPPDAMVVAQEAATTAWDAVATLPPLQRRAVALRFGQDLSHAEVGQRIGRSEAATKQLVYRAMLTLRARLGQEARL
jgi:RNA polymerase sigma-70 factor, ECF subfamily